MKEDLLAVADVVARIDDPAAGIDRALSDRRVGLVGPVGEQDEDEEAGEDDEPGDLDPRTRDEQLAFPGWVVSRRRASGLFSSVLPQSSPIRTKDRCFGLADPIPDGHARSSVDRRRDQLSLTTA